MSNLAKFLGNSGYKIEKELTYTGILVRVIPLYSSMLQFRFVKKAVPGSEPTHLFDLSTPELKDLARELTKLSRLEEAKIDV